MKFSYNWLKELVPFKETPEKLADFLTLRAFEVESIKKAGSDFTLDLKLPANRVADAAGHLGFAREIASLKKLRLKTQSFAPKIKEDKKYKTSDYLSVRIENQNFCPRYSTRILGEVTVKSSPKWLRDKLEGCGIQSINNIVDAANYCMFETGEPLHIFDFEKLHSHSRTKKTIFVRDTIEGEKITTLDGKIYALPRGTLVIADEEGPLAIAGIKGGATSGVSDETSTIILEAANFNPEKIRESSQALSLHTDASIRFEHGLDPNQTSFALDRLAELIQELAGGIILHGSIDMYPRREKNKEIPFRVEYANNLIGLLLEAQFYHDTLQSIGCIVRAKRKDEFIVEPPTIRRDLAIEEDLIEEAVRILGFDAIPASTPEVAALSPRQTDELFWEKNVADYAVSAGFHESLVYEFTGLKELEQFHIESNHIIELQNPTSPDTQYLLPRALIKYILETAQNLHHADSVRLFGIAKSFAFFSDQNPKENETPASETKDLIFTLAEKNAKNGEEFFMLKGILDGFFESLGIAEHWYDNVISSWQATGDNQRLFHPYRVAEVKVGNEKLGIIGEIHPEILARLKTKTRIVVSELDFEALWRRARAEREFTPVNKFPAIIRDIAIGVPASVKTEEVLNIIEAAGGEFLYDVDLFDYFQDETMKESEEKSLAFHLIFQSSDRTLKDEEVEKNIKSIITALDKKGWGVRK